MLVEGMGIIKARERLNMFDVTSYPQANNKDRKKAHKDTYKAAYPTRFQEKNAVSLDDAFKMLGRF
jgi:hypothetical protein